MASMRSVYSLLRLTSLKRPTRWCDLMPSSCSSGCTKVPNMSSSMPLQPSWITLSTSMLTRVVKTMGFLPSTSPVWLICRTAWWALSTVSMKGRRTWRGFMSNWARMALPKVSAVMPVPSETKNTVRECMEPLFLDAACASGVDTTKRWQRPVLRQSRESVSPLPEARAYNCLNYPILTMHRVGPQPQRQSLRPCMAACQEPSRARHADPVSTSGAFPCLHFSARPPWSYRLKT